MRTEIECRGKLGHTFPEQARSKLLALSRCPKIVVTRSLTQLSRSIFIFALNKLDAATHFQSCQPIMISGGITNLRGIGCESTKAGVCLASGISACTKIDCAKIACV